MTQEDNILKSGNLRKLAEEKLVSRSKPFSDFTLRDIKAYIHEIQVHQIELEMQNEELLRAQNRLRESETKYQEFYNLAPVGFITLDEEGVVKEVNSTFLEMLSITKLDIYMKDFVSIVDWADRDKIYFLIRDILSSGLKKETQVKFLNESNKHFYATIQGKSYFIERTNSSVIRLVITDISKQKDYEFELIALLEELRVANDTINDKAYTLDEMKCKLESIQIALTEEVNKKDEFISLISDDLMKVFSIFLKLSDRISDLEELRSKSEILDISSALHDSVKGTLFLLEKYYKIRKF